MRVVSLLLFASCLMQAQTPFIGRATTAAVQPSDQVFPHIAVGGGWRTTIVIVNIGTPATNFELRFYGQDGKPLPVTFSNPPLGEIITTTSVQGRLTPGASFHYEIVDSGPLRTGWATLAYDSAQTRIGGYATFRQTVTGRPDFEALVPLSALDDYKFFMPFDNRPGVATAMAIANPDPTRSITVTLQFLDIDGKLIRTESLLLPPLGQTSFSIAERFTPLAGQVGTIYAQGSLDRLSALGLRFNTGAGNAFSSIPIMNWSGMFQ
ncbi:MAG: hypothetical protein ABI972_06400 [Acidobacteriota bacterium]